MASIDHVSGKGVVRTTLLAGAAIAAVLGQPKDAAAFQDYCIVNGQLVPVADKKCDGKPAGSYEAKTVELKTLLRQNLANTSAAAQGVIRNQDDARRRKLREIANSPD